jgi:hypothetical protein
MSTSKQQAVGSDAGVDVHGTACSVLLKLWAFLCRTDTGSCSVTYVTSLYIRLTHSVESSGD